MYPPYLVENYSAGAGFSHYVGMEGQLVIQCHTQLPFSLSQEHHRILNCKREVMDGRCLPRNEEQHSFVEAELQTVQISNERCQQDKQGLKGQCVMI